MDLVPSTSKSLSCFLSGSQNSLIQEVVYSGKACVVRKARDETSQVKNIVSKSKARAIRRKSHQSRVENIGFTTWKVRASQCYHLARSIESTIFRLQKVDYDLKDLSRSSIDCRFRQASLRNQRKQLWGLICKNVEKFHAFQRLKPASSVFDPSLSKCHDFLEAIKEKKVRKRLVCFVDRAILLRHNIDKAFRDERAGTKTFLSFTKSL